MKNKLVSETRLGNQAKSLLQDELSQEILSSMKDNIWKGFKATTLGDSETLVSLRYLLKAVESFEENLQEIIDTGDLAQATLKESEDKEDEKS